MPRLAVSLAALLCIAGGASPALAAKPPPGKHLRLHVVTGTGNPTKAINRFRTFFGPDNGGAPGGNPKGHREIHWHGVPDQLAEPNALPGAYFSRIAAQPAPGTSPH